MAKVTSNDAEAQDALRRLGSKFPKEVAKQDRKATSPAKEQKAPVEKVRKNAKNTSAAKSDGDGSPGANMGHKSSPSPVKITAKKSDKRS